jgi:glycosyltransferase involved in cell wall biosynthesis
VGQTHPREKFELIVVDDGSEDGTHAMIDRLGVSYRLSYVRQANQGRSSARNHGIRLARGSLVILTDDDCLAVPEFISAHVSAHRGRDRTLVRGSIYNIAPVKFFQDPSEAVLFPGLRVNVKNLENLRRYCIRSEDVLLHFGRIRQDHRRKTAFEKAVEQAIEDGIVPWIACTGANISFLRNRQTQEDIVFDEAFGGKWSNEDIELGFRLSQAGYRYVFAGEAAVFHLAHFRMDSLELQRETFQYFCRKHPFRIVRLLWEEFFARDLDLEHLYRVLGKIRGPDRQAGGADGSGTGDPRRP